MLKIKWFDMKYAIIKTAMEEVCMIRKTIQTIADYLQASIHGCSNNETMIQGVAIDSRQVKQGTLYIPMIGARVDGHQFIESVQKNGAAASLWQKDHKPYPDFPVILVDDTQKALQDLARAYMNDLDCLVIGVTGSNGKTSCKDMLYSVFSPVVKTQKTEGNHNNEIGLPLTVLDLDEDVEVAILEMGMEGFDEISFLCSIAQPDISIITSIGSAHMETLGSKKGIARAKCEILEHTKAGGLFLYPNESEEIAEVLEEITYDSSIRLQAFGKGSKLCVEGDIEHRKDGISFMCSILEHKVELNVLGDFQADNALSVIYAAKERGIQEEDILKGLSHIQMTKMRTQRLTVKKAIIIDDTYKSNPESACVAIDTLMNVPAPLHIAVFSDMLDLGPKENELHEQVGQYALEKGVDAIYCVGPLSRYTVEGANDKGKWFENKEELVSALKPFLEQDCVMVIKGSRAMAMDTVVSDLQGE